jgi:hypothetical protein
VLYATGLRSLAQFGADRTRLGMVSHFFAPRPPTLDRV